MGFERPMLRATRGDSAEFGSRTPETRHVTRGTRGDKPGVTFHRATSSSSVDSGRFLIGTKCPTRGVNTLDLAVSDVGTILQALALPNLAPAQGTLPHLRTIIIEDLTGFDPSPFLSFLTFRRQYPPEPAAEGRLILPHQWRYMWMDRDPELQGWKEGVEIVAGMPRLEDVDWVGARVISAVELDSV
ncbi:hypothetical protein FA13DRAFT_1711667 [Coprinellus micaceus]|uniref:Uncharacterized protein n=1 Tax=Coprinellus micaceus TaxID=71717 RepID=A0A4Y7T3R0_COPMI|nr:hypothetical protein FA13DRAFT_1711667 [Coprinellus micaceus]